ncbi:MULTISPECIES: DUF6474 family protein [unclassified Actinopolyspora]|uniref:DUF6474 family protein n=1 Tax=Actinopolyspora TaxID=1849 RepID=UPI001A984436|nr:MULTISPECIES: DUF6474 family protein [unclassified Actinopolyspora]
MAGLKRTRRASARARRKPGKIADEAKQQRRAERTARKADKRAVKAAQKGEHGRITPGNAKKVVGVAKIVGPVLAPYAAQAATGARETYERFRARRLGVAVEDVSRFSGRGAALHARIAGDAKALEELRHRGDGADESVTRFVDSAQRRLEEMSSAVRAAERMPASRRRAAHRAVDGELGRIEDDLLRRFGARAD